MRLIMPVWSSPARDKIKLSVLLLLIINHHQRPLIFSQFSPVIGCSLVTTKLTIHYSGRGRTGGKMQLTPRRFICFLLTKCFPQTKTQNIFTKIRLTNDIRHCIGSNWNQRGEDWNWYLGPTPKIINYWKILIYFNAKTWAATNFINIFD